MSTVVIHSPGIDSSLGQTTVLNLSADRENLAALRFFILLTARREALENAGPEGRERTESDLAWLRTQYFEMIDEIAMRHGVQQAMDAKAAVERDVTVPRMWPPLESLENEESWL